MPQLLWDTQVIQIKVANLLPGQHPSNIVRDSEAFQQTAEVPAKYWISCRFHFGTVQQIRKWTVTNTRFCLHLWVMNLWWSGLLFNYLGEMDSLHAKGKVTEQQSSSRSWSNGKFHSCVVSGFRRHADEICALLGYYAALSNIPEERTSLPHSWLMDVWITGKLNGSFQGHISVFIFCFSAFTTWRTQNYPLPCGLELQTSVSGNCPSNFTQHTGTPALSLIIVNWPTPKVSPLPYYQPHCYRLFKNCGTLSIHKINKKFWKSDILQSSATA